MKASYTLDCNLACLRIYFELNLICLPQYGSRGKEILKILVVDFNYVCWWYSKRKQDIDHAEMKLYSSPKLRYEHLEALCL